MDDAKAASVAKALDTVALRYRMPRYLIMDSGHLYYRALVRIRNSF